MRVDSYSRLQNHPSRIPSNHQELWRISPLPSIQVVRYRDEQRGESETGQRRPAMVRFRDPGPISKPNELTLHSIQEALRTYLQPIKHDDPQLDFYTMYKRESVEYDTEYMQKYNEDLNNTLIFVRLSCPFINV